MNETEKFILNGSLNKSSKNENASISLNFSGNKRILPETSIDAIIDSYDIYLNERKKSNKFRITVNIIPYCTNILFNPFTEMIMKNDNGSISVLNYFGGITTQSLIDKRFIHDGDVIGKNSVNDGVSTEDFLWTPYKAIRDTQLTNKKCGFEYYCGIDIFNNHILRNKSFKTVTFTLRSQEPISSYKSVYGYENELAYDQNINGLCTTNYNYVIPENFNTIDDYLRNRFGIIVSSGSHMLVINPPSDSDEHTETIGDGTIRRYERRKCGVTEINCPMHLYQRYDVYSYEECIEKNLKEVNGWFGFYNKSIANTISFMPTLVSGVYTENDEYEYDINKVINNKSNNDFIDMYPTRSHYSFSPYYNSDKERLEKNWNYCITYPSESVIKMIDGSELPFFRYIQENDKETIALKVLMIDEYTVDDNGIKVVTVYTICQHGLKSGDKINVYVNGKIFYTSIDVLNVLDKYTFQFYKQSANISNEWVDLSDESIIDIEDGYRVINITTMEGERKLYDNVNFLFESSNSNKYYIAGSNRCNIDVNAQDISFKRVVDNVECKYYIRMFSRLPNFKFKDAEINDETLYGKSSKDLDLINKFSDPSKKTNDFENHISKLSFSETAYGDDNTEIVYTDDIDVSYLRDNLGRPLNEIFFTVVKNNNGYKKWYGIDEQTINVNDDSIEKSHCFGKNSSSFLLSDFYINAGKTLNDVRKIHMKNLGLMYDNGDDEIDFNKVKKFYGDLCCYSPIDCDEQIIQSVHNRFNTVQRELADYDADANRYFDGKLYYDEIINDESSDFDLTDGNVYEKSDIDFYREFNTKEGKLRHSTYSEQLLDNKENLHFSNMTSQREGYYYKSHYRIRLKTVSKTLNTDDPIKYDIYEIKYEGNQLTIKTYENNFLEINDKLILYFKEKNEFYYLVVKNIYSKKYFTCSVKDEEYNDVYIDNGDLDIEKISLIKKHDYVPFYAKIIKDGSCRFYWREIISNGVEDGDSKIYPFTNGAFYINRNINFYLKRQDPFKEYSYLNVGYSYVPEGQSIDVYGIENNDNNYYEADEIEKC